MASSFSLSNATFPVGQIQRSINGVPPSANGFKLDFTRDASWDTPGAMADFVAEISPDNGANWSTWITGHLGGGPAKNRDGSPATKMAWTALWPGIYPDTVTRQVLLQTDVRITFTTVRAFTSPLVTITTV